MTSADVRDVLSLPLKENVTPTPHTKTKQKARLPKADGMTRELYSLLGDNAPPLALLQPQRFKERPRLNQKAASWEWKAFQNEARTDGLELYHWRKHQDGPDSSEPYAFSKFNQKPTVVSYTDEEYKSYFSTVEWSREETDYLFEMCREFDLRFIIIQDRWGFEGPERSVEEMKERFYSITRKILELRTPIPMMSAMQLEEMKSLNFNKEQETERKAHIISLMKRSSEQIAEENALVGELRKLNTKFKAMEKERTELLNLLSAPPTTGNITPYQGSQGLSNLITNLQAADREKKKKKVPLNSLPNINPPPSVSIISNTNKSSAAAAPGTTESLPKVRKFTPKEEQLYGISYPEGRSISGVQLRSQKPPVIKQSQQSRIYSVLTELGIPLRLIMSTKDSMAKFEALQLGIAAMLDVKKGIDRVEQEGRIGAAREKSEVPGPSFAAKSSITEEDEDTNFNSSAADRASLKRSASVQSEEVTEKKQKKN